MSDSIIGRQACVLQGDRNWANFSTFGDCLFWAVFYVSDRVSPIFLDSFFQSKSCVFIFGQKCWATFWAMFSQTHVVTLAVDCLPQEFEPTNYTTNKRYTQLCTHTCEINEVLNF
jgi:hypothetical protein